MRAAIVAEALSWTGTPYAHHGRIKGLACDCAQLPAAVFEAVGIIPHVELQYSPQWMMHRDEELYLDEIRRWAREIDPETVKPGDLVVWKFGRTFSHSAIVIEAPLVIHSAVRGSAVFQMNMDQDSDYRSPRPRKAFSVFEANGQLVRR
jgi:cell wall-associated NlpC family hydrolase